MKSLVAFSALVALVASKSITNEDTIDLENNPNYGYLTKIGLPLATKIREAETQFTTSSEADKPVIKIVDGAGARLGEFPYQAGILAEFVLGHSVCGGSLVNARRVLTAAHCWSDGQNQASMFTIVLGSIKLFTGGVRLKTSNVIMHSNWNPQRVRNDIAMVYLPNAVQLSNIISPIALPSGSELQKDFVGDTAVASGFGKTKDGNKITANTFLSHVKLQVVPNSVCSRVYGFVQSSIICTKGAIYENICGGDSGGPLAVTRNNKRILIGVTSFGHYSCENGAPGGFTRVTFFINWINSHL